MTSPIEPDPGAVGLILADAGAIGATLAAKAVAAALTDIGRPLPARSRRRPGRG